MLAHHQQFVWFRHIQATRRKSLARFGDVKIVDRHLPAPAVGGDGGAECGFVETLVRAKAYITVDSKQRLFWFHVDVNAVVELRNTEDHVLHHIDELRAQALVVLAVRVEP